jgi:hypothetical protein
MPSHELSCFYATRVNVYNLMYSDLRVRIAIILGTKFVVSEFSYKYIAVITSMQICSCFCFCFKIERDLIFQDVMQKITWALSVQWTTEAYRSVLFYLWHEIWCSIA